MKTSHKTASDSLALALNNIAGGTINPAVHGTVVGDCGGTLDLPQLSSEVRMLKPKARKIEGTLMEWSYLGLLKMLLVEGAARHDDEGANLLLQLAAIIEVGGEVFLAVAKVAASNRLGVA